MKAIYLSFVVVLFTAFAHAQNISVNPGTKTVEGWVNAHDATSAQVVITNNSTETSDSIIRWEIVSFEKPASWRLDFCDPDLCIPSQRVGSSGAFLLKPGNAGPLKCDFYDSLGLTTGGTGTVKVVLSYVNGSANSDTATFVARGWATGIKQIRNAAEVSLYPNPSRNDITLKYPVTKPIEVSIYNVLGSKVKTFLHSGSETTIHISDLQKGLYFIRFTQGDAMISKSFTKVD